MKQYDVKISYAALSDMGGFDAVTRATANHGLHRGSFQTMATVYDANGKTYALAGWKDKTTMILTDGSTVSCSKGKINGKIGRAHV